MRWIAITLVTLTVLMAGCGVSTNVRTALSKPEIATLGDEGVAAQQDFVERMSKMTREELEANARENLDRWKKLQSLTHN
jgi:hypothetical protein